MTRHNDSVTAAEDLTPWLHAQLDEDERDGGIAHCPGCEGDESECDVDSVRSRVLREVEATRKILDLCDEISGLDEMADERRHTIRDLAVEPFLGDQVARLLALPYAGRPGYRSEWAP